MSATRIEIGSRKVNFKKTEISLDTQGVRTSHTIKNTNNFKKHGVGLNDNKQNITIKPKVGLNNVNQIN